MRNLVLKLSSGIGVLSAQESEEFAIRWPTIATKLFVVKNVVRSEFIAAKVKSNERAMIFFASRFMRDKGVFDILEAIPGILEIIPDCRFTFVGDGPDVVPFLRRVAELDLSGVIDYMTNRTYIELIELYIEGGIFVFPTHFPEGMPMALIEAMAVGLLVISSPVRFVRDIVILRSTDLVLTSDCDKYPDQIAKIVTRIVKDVALRKKVGECNKKIAGQFSQKEVASEFATLYGTLLNR
jgi:glycosyltransferase involved in cell wall biosynthesis